VAGTEFKFTVIAQTAANATATGYTGTVVFSSTDNGASTVLPVNATLVKGVGVFSANLTTAGNQILRATDSSASAVTGSSGPITVSAAKASHFVVSTPATAVAGASFKFTVTALDKFNNIARGYTGNVTFSASDPNKNVSLPGKSKLTAGVGVFSATLVTAGAQTLTATDNEAHISGQGGAITVSAAAVTHFEIVAPATVTAGAAFQFTIIAEDMFNNVVTNYSGTIHFTSSDSTAVLPGNVTLTGGIGVFSATLSNTKGDQKILATSTANSAISGTSNKINVKGKK
jgi:hypothetical protein